MDNKLQFFGTSQNPYVLSKAGKGYDVSYFKGNKAVSKNFNTSTKAKSYIKTKAKVYK